MSKIETLARNISVVRNAAAKFDFSVLDPRDIKTIEAGIEYVTGLCQCYIDIENGVGIDIEV